MAKSNVDTKTSGRARPRSRRSRAAGLTLVELLIALAIMALMMAAVAVALDAALQNYQANQEVSETMLSVRNGLHHVTTTIRSAWNDPDHDVIAVSSDGNQCSLVDAQGRQVAFRYDSSTRRIQVDYDAAGAWHTLVDNVDPLATGEPVFSASAPVNPDLDAGTVGRVDLRFRVAGDQGCYPVTVGVVPRNVVYAR